MIKLFSSFFCMLFFLQACSAITMEKSYTEIKDNMGNGYRCEFIHNEKINCEKIKGDNDEKEVFTAFLW